MKLKGYVLAIMLAAVLLGAGTRRAHACGGGYDDGGFALVLAGLGAVGVDALFTGVDVVNQAPADLKSLPKAYGFAELLLTLPQAAWLGLATGQLVAEGGYSFGAAATTVLTLWTGSLAAHGLYVMVQGGHPSPPREPVRRAAVDWRVAPALVSAGAARASPGAVLFGRF
jgi:hypothetical protein